MRKILVSGANGDMGKRVIEILKKMPDMEFFKGIDIKKGKDIVVNITDELIKACDGIIDFSSPALTMEVITYAKKHNKPMVIATTGFNTDEIKNIEETSKSIPILFSPNMSKGVNIMFYLIDELTKLIPEYENEIVEIHHHRKKDAPSGTAKKLAEIIGKNKEIKEIYDRTQKKEPRKFDELGVFSLRGGDVAGEHTVYFFGNGERLEITHRVSNRNTFAQGAVDSLKFLFTKSSGLFSMMDVLNNK